MRAAGGWHWEWRREVIQRLLWQVCTADGT